MPSNRDVIKTHSLQFLSQQAGADDANKARQLLSNVKGIEAVERLPGGKLQIRYDVRQLTLQMIAAALHDVGFRLNTGLLTRIKLSLIAYCEDTQRASLGVIHDAEQAILNPPDTVTHDPRPHNWRNYL